MLSMLLMAGAVNAQIACPLPLVKELEGRTFDDVEKDIRHVAKGPELRIIPEGSEVTQDWRSTRLNVELGQDGRIRRFWCG